MLYIIWIIGRYLLFAFIISFSLGASQPFRLICNIVMWIITYQCLIIDYSRIRYGDDSYVVDINIQIVRCIFHPVCEFKKYYSDKDPADRWVFWFWAIFIPVVITCCLCLIGTDGIRFLYNQTLEYFNAVFDFSPDQISKTPKFL